MCRCRAVILAAFDRRKCKGPLNGPQAAEASCARKAGRSTPFPGPQFRNVAETGSAEASYYTWVDQFNTLGLGNNVPIATGNANDSLMALVDGKWVNMRVPYPLGFFAKGIDGRIDDPNAGWKGRALWSTDGNRTPFHLRDRQGNPPEDGEVPGPARSAGGLIRSFGLSRVEQTRPHPTNARLRPGICFFGFQGTPHRPEFRAAGASARNLKRWIFPVAVFGSALRNSIQRGYL